MTTAALTAKTPSLSQTPVRKAVQPADQRSLPSGNPTDQVQLSGGAPAQETVTLKSVALEAAKGLPKAMLRHLVGSLCAPVGVVLGSLYAGTLVGPILTATQNPSPAPSLEAAVWQAQLPLGGLMMMGSADMLSSGGSALGVFAKEMAAPLTLGFEAYKYGYNLLR